jgi:hypothetical protein
MTAWLPGRNTGGNHRCWDRPGSDLPGTCFHQRYYSLDSERGLATPSPGGKGRDHLVPSLMIMPVDS